MKVNKKLFVIICFLIINKNMLISQLDSGVSRFMLIKNATNVKNITKPYLSIYQFYKFNALYNLYNTKQNPFNFKSRSILFSNDNNFSNKVFNNLGYQHKEFILPALYKILNEYSDLRHPYFSNIEEFNIKFINDRNLYTSKNGYFLSSSGLDPRYIFTNGYYINENDIFLIPWIYFLISDIKQSHESNFGQSK